MHSNKEMLVIKLYVILTGRLWKFTYADTSAFGWYFKATLARKGVLFNFIKSSYASPGSILTTILFEDLSSCAHLPVHLYIFFIRNIKK